MGTVEPVRRRSRSHIVLPPLVLNGTLDLPWGVQLTRLRGLVFRAGGLAAQSQMRIDTADC